MEAVDLLGSLSVEDMNRVVEITGDWATMTANHDALRQMFDILDCGFDTHTHSTSIEHTSQTLIFYSALSIHPTHFPDVHLCFCLFVCVSFLSGDIVDGVRTNFIGREELRYFLIGLRVPGIDDDRVFAAQWAMVDTKGDGRVRERDANIITTQRSQGESTRSLTYPTLLCCFACVTDWFP